MSICYFRMIKQRYYFFANLFFWYVLSVFVVGCKPLLQLTSSAMLHTHSGATWRGRKNTGMRIFEWMIKKSRRWYAAWNGTNQWIYLFSFVFLSYFQRCNQFEKYVRTERIFSTFLWVLLVGSACPRGGSARKKAHFCDFIVIIIMSVIYCF